MLANDWPPLFEVAFHIVLDVLLGVFLAYSVVLVGSTTSSRNKYKYAECIFVVVYFCRCCTSMK